MEFILSSQAVRQIEAMFDSWSRRQRTTWQQPFYRPPFSAGGGDNCYKVAVKNDVTYAHGLYERTSCNPDVWEAIILFGECPSSSSMVMALSNSGFLQSAPPDYEPGGTWTAGPTNGYNAAWYSPDCDPPAPTALGEWVAVPIVDGGKEYCVYRLIEQGWICYGGGFTS